MILVLLKKDSETKAFVSPTDFDDEAISEALALVGESWDDVVADDEDRLYRHPVYTIETMYIDETTEIFIS
jgi:hypothetical protein